MIHGSRVPLPPSCTLGSPSSLSATVFLVSFKPREKPFQYLGFFGSSMTQSTTLAVVTSEQREWNHDQTKLTSSLCCFASLILKRPRHSWFKSRPCPWSNVRVFFSGQFLTTLKSMVHGCQGALSWIRPTLLWNILTLWCFWQQGKDLTQFLHFRVQGLDAVLKGSYPNICIAEKVLVVDNHLLRCSAGSSRSCSDCPTSLIILIISHLINLLWPREADVPGSLSEQDEQDPAGQWTHLVLLQFCGVLDYCLHGFACFGVIR